MNISLVLSRRYPGAEWTLDGDTYAGLTWLSESPKPSEEDLHSEWAQVEYEVAFEAVELARQAAYQKESDPLFFSFQRGEATELEWLAAVDGVKVTHPYPVDPATVEPEPVVEPVVIEEEV